MLAKYEQSKGKMISFTGAEAWLVRKEAGSIGARSLRMEPDLREFSDPKLLRMLSRQHFFLKFYLVYLFSIRALSKDGIKGLGKKS